jgi:hypothetical protein
MSAAITTVDMMGVSPDDIEVRTFDDFAIAKIGSTSGGGQVGLFPAVATARSRHTNASVGQLMQIGERLAREARRAGHAHRTALRTQRLADALAVEA